MDKTKAKTRDPLVKRIEKNISELKKVLKEINSIIADSGQGDLLSALEDSRESIEAAINYLNEEIEH